MTPAREEYLLSLVPPLALSLARAEIFKVEAGEALGERVGFGVKSSTLGNVQGFLHRSRDLPRCRAFVEELDQLDSMTAQNPRKPSGLHRALRQILTPWLDEHVALDADEVLFVLSWVRRFLPTKSREVGQTVEILGLEDFEPWKPTDPSVAQVGNPESEAGTQPSEKFQKSTPGRDREGVDE